MDGDATFQIQDETTLATLALVSTAYDAEDLLQEGLATHPDVPTAWPPESLVWPRATYRKSQGGIWKVHRQ